jgi:hypothetical protein
MAVVAGVSSVIAAGGTSEEAGPIAPRQLQVSRKPQLRGGADGRGAWLVAEHRGLTLLKVVTRADRSVAIELRFREDAVSLAVDGSGTVTVGRAGRAVRVTTPEAIEQLQQLVAGSEAVFATRMLLAERESTSDLQPHEMSVLAVAAFVASLTGDADAPTRLSRRFLEKHLGVFTRVRSETCFEKYPRVNRLLERHAGLRGGSGSGRERLGARLPSRRVQWNLAYQERGGLVRVRRLHGTRGHHRVR